MTYLSLQPLFERGKEGMKGGGNGVVVHGDGSGKKKKRFGVNAVVDVSLPSR